MVDFSSLIFILVLEMVSCKLTIGRPKNVSCVSYIYVCSLACAFSECNVLCTMKVKCAQDINKILHFNVSKAFLSVATRSYIPKNTEYGKIRSV